MKKLIYLFLTVLIVGCSDDDGNPCLYNPTLTTSAVTNITETSATLNGVISIVSQNCDDPNNTEQGFVYATTIQPTIANTKVNVNGTDITTTLENLEPNTTYYARTFLTNAFGEFYGNEVSFTSDVTESLFKGFWSGGFTGDDLGTWTLTVQNNGTMEGSFTSKDFNEIYSLSGFVDENGMIQASLTLENAVGSFEGNLNNGEASGSYSVNGRNGDFQGRISTNEEKQLVNYWNYYSAEYTTGEILYYDNEIYCPGLYMEFREDGTFTDYFYADYVNSDPNCPQEEMYGTFSVQEGYYEFLYILGGSQDLSGNDFYITFPDENTMNYNYQDVLWTYKISID